MVSAHQRRIVARCCERADAAGVWLGMPAAQARALFDAGDVRIEAHDPVRDLAALRSLAVWAHCLSPRVAIDDGQEEPDGLLIDVTGCEGVFGGEARLLRSAMEGLARLGIRARATIAPTFGAARAVARFGGEEETIIPAGGAREAIAPLPVAALRLGEELVTGLAEVGIERIEHLLELPRSALPARFGAEILLHLDRALGQAIETIEPVRPVAALSAERVFDGPTDRTEAIELTVRELVGEIAEALRARESGARSLEVELVRSDLAPESLLITLGRPSRDGAHLWALLRPKLERAHLGFGVEAVRIRVGSVGRVGHRQVEQWGDGRSMADSDRAFAELLDTLSNRLGAGRVVRASMVESHLPERAFQMEAATMDRRSDRASITRADRPTVLLDRPAPVDVMSLASDGSVHRVRWRGEDHDVLACLGPERIAPEWWRSPGSTRDYLATQIEGGRWLWLVRALETGRWFVHGVWA